MTPGGRIDLTHTAHFDARSAVIKAVFTTWGFLASVIDVDSACPQGGAKGRERAQGVLALGVPRVGLKEDGVLDRSN